MSALGGKESFNKAFLQKNRVVAEAATGAMDLAADRIKRDGRASIQAGGFKKRWQNALRVDRHPKKAVSINAAVYVYHKIPYAPLFEFGGTVSGKPLLWVPTRNSPAKIGRSKVSPRRFHSQVANLRSAKGVDRPMLVADYRRGRGRPKKGAPKANVIFVGIPRVKIPKKFSITKVVDRTIGKLGSFYNESLKLE